MPSISRSRGAIAAIAATAVAAYLAHRTILTEVRAVAAQVEALTSRVGANYWQVYNDVQRDLLLHPEDR